jgi:hypothetical protein
MERFRHANEETALNPDPFDLVKRDFVAGAVVELGRARGLVRGHGLGILGAAGLEIGGDAGRPEHMAAELDLKAGKGTSSASMWTGTRVPRSKRTGWPVAGAAGLCQELLNYRVAT